MIPQLPITLEEDGSDYDGPLSTFKEWHALTLGVGLGLLLAVSYAVESIPLPVVGAVVARTMLYAHTGRRVEIGGKKIDMPTKYLRQIRAEPHYLDGGIALGLILSSTITVIA